MRETRIALAAGLALTAIALGFVLSRSPSVVIRSSAPPTGTVAFGRSEVRSRICQADEVLPLGATAIRVWLEAVIGPPVSVEVLARRQLLAHGSRGPGWTAGSVTIPIGAVRRTVSHVTVCVTVGRQREPIGIHGVRTAPAIAATDRQGPFAQSAHTRAGTYKDGPLPGRLMIQYVGTDSRSWWSLVVSVARRMGLGRADSGTWVALLALMLMVAVAVGMSLLILRGLA
jgi:hypothetical protein